ncbi:N-acetylglucosamine-6-phosphate deacetylase [Tumebacillus sp. DT12]|uniref:N-acetylglucosamine-6-phosphate deacetylase n=1 Tax=Tumebacillus lacus TaxID=2995335 RepID=A0ABT3WYI3_9BACL|nr:N-acetylglucosamine-6-phosphate deacetylase [Tumebacillus lacus]MCX7568812.1 N-acetylglucosamine-6-phosphate deacetylase [Tumebacillus lacus]
MNQTIIQGNLVVGRQILDDHLLIVADGKITYIGPRRDETPDLICAEGYIVPGYLDVHVHGSNGHDVMDGSRAALEGISASLARYGVTGYLATTLTGGIGDLRQVLAACRQFADERPPGAELLGIHLEGPWINMRHKGAQNAAFVVTPAVEDADALLQAAGGLLKVVTLAPEHPESHEVIAHLTAHGVQVSVGHSDATYDHVKEAMNHGLSHVTHCYNAMRPLHHREPGVVGAAMYHDELTTELIADGVHVHPVAMSILYRLKRANNLVLVSDGMRAVGMEDGAYDLGGLDVLLKDGEARLPDGTLAGSTLTLDRAVQNMVRLCRVPLPEAVEMATATPARLIGVADRKGRLAVGHDADFLVLDTELNVVRTYGAGRLLYEKKTTLL